MQQTVAEEQSRFSYSIAIDSHNWSLAKKASELDMMAPREGDPGNQSSSPPLEVVYQIHEGYHDDSEAIARDAWHAGGLNGHYPPQFFDHQAIHSMMYTQHQPYYPNWQMLSYPYAAVSQHLAPHPGSHLSPQPSPHPNPHHLVQATLSTDMSSPGQYHPENAHSLLPMPPPPPFYPLPSKYVTRNPPVPARLPSGPPSGVSAGPPTGIPTGIPTALSFSKPESSSSFGSVDTAEHLTSKPSKRGKRRSLRRRKQRTSSHTRAELKYNDKTTLHLIKDRIVETAKDQDGSRFIQQRLEIADTSEVALAYTESIEAMEQLWNDVYGNFILQCLLDHSTAEMKKKFTDRIKPDIVTLSLRVYGCRVVQKAFDTLSKEDVAELVATFKGKNLVCIHDHNGNHVIQKAITIMSEHAKKAKDDGDDETCSFLLNKLDAIIDEVIENIESLSQHPYGCRVVQRAVEYCIEPQKSRILDEIILCHRSLVDDQYGNYVIQRALTYGRASDRESIFQSIILDGQIIRLSKKKQASNVVEVLLKTGNADQRRKIVQEILDHSFSRRNGSNTAAVVSMALDAYANYVVKTALEVIEKGPQRDELFDILSLNVDLLETVPYAKHIVTKVKAHQQPSIAQKTDI